MKINVLILRLDFTRIYHYFSPSLIILKNKIRILLSKTFNRTTLNVMYFVFNEYNNILSHIKVYYYTHNK